MSVTSIVNAARKDGVITHPEFVNIVNASETIEEAQAALKPLIDMFDVDAQQSWEAFFGVAGMFRPTPFDRGWEGPFFIPNAPVRADGDISHGLPGQKMVITGKVTDAQGNPIANAVLDVWENDKDGAYHDFIRPGVPVRNPTFALRGRIITDANGNYTVKGIVPGHYDVGGAVRPMHVHWKVTAPGERTLTTQTYFDNDPVTTDPVGFFREELVMQTQERDGTLHAKFDFVLP
jgi:protocatechuate 3,4-dioxygenase beta subunit